MEYTDATAKRWGDRLEEDMLEHRSATSEGKILARVEDLVWGTTKMSTSCLVVSPLNGFALKTMHAHLDEMRPRTNSGRHRHASEAIMHCLEGRAYSVIDGVRYDWHAGDTFVIPSGAWHQHFNESEQPVRYFVVSNWPLTVAVGLGYMDYGEINSDYTPSV